MAHFTMRTTIALIPGLLCNHTLWRSQIEALIDYGDVEVADITQQTTIQQMAMDVMDRLPGRFCLAGFSLGSQVALEIMELAGERVDRLALLSATRGGLTPLARSAINGAIDTVEAGGLDQYLKRAYPTYFAPSQADDAELQTAFENMAHAVGPEAGLRQMHALLAITNPFAALDRIKCPTVIIGGSEDLRTPPSAHALLAQEIPQSKLTMIEGAAHFTTLERPAVVAAALREWIAG
jgi:pimeloyl-ACP methyl ester carboxylesterase